jgi:hypothetical protein
MRRALGSLLLFLAGCGTLTTHHVMTGPAGPPRDGDVRVVIEGAPEPPGLQEVAIIQSVGTGIHANLEDLVGGLKERARALGCDVIVHVHVDQGASNAAASGVAARTGAAAYLPPPAPPPTQPPPPPPAPEAQ